MARKKEIKKKEKEMRIIEIPLSNFMSHIEDEIRKVYGECEIIEYQGDQEQVLTFKIPARGKGQCGETFYFVDEEDPDVEGCAGTGAACVCLLSEGHEGDHECVCGNEW